MAKKIKSPKAKATKRPDEIISTSQKVFDYVLGNRKTILIGVSAVCFVLFLFFGWLIYSKRTEKSASKLYYQALQYYQGDENAGSSGQVQEENRTLSLETLKRVIEKYPRTRASYLALLYAGHIDFEKKEFDEAIEFYERFLERASSSHPFNIFALDGLGYSYEAKGDYENACRYFKKLVDTKGNSLTQFAFLNVGHCYERFGEKEKAIESYQKFLASNPDSAYSSLAKENMRALQRQL